ncbi:MAG: SET domain-containing protein, partial [Ginsengibacter sp.]
HAQKQKKYVVKGDSVSGYGIYAAKDIQSGEVVFLGEENPHRLITKKYVEENWNKDDLENFRRYAWPLSQEVYILWDNNPREWAPQNHSCDANTHYSGLNVLAKKQIRKNDELTLDYTSFLNNEMESFICNCGTSDCRKIIQGKQENSISYLLKPI